MSKVFTPEETTVDPPIDEEPAVPVEPDATIPADTLPSSETTTSETTTTPTTATPVEKFPFVCEYVGINGDKCNKKCKSELGCAHHKDKVGYTIQCSYPECRKMTRSDHRLCAEHYRRRPADKSKKDEYSEEVAALTIRLKELGFIPSIRKAREPIAMSVKQPSLTPAH